MARQPEDLTEVLAKALHAQARVTGDSRQEWGALTPGWRDYYATAAKALASRLGVAGVTLARESELTALRGLVADEDGHCRVCNNVLALTGKHQPGCPADPTGGRKS